MRPILITRSGVEKNKGPEKANDEDFYALYEPRDLEILQESGCFYVVADGVTGGYGGERASKYASEMVLHDYYSHRGLPPDERLRIAFRRANQDVYEYKQSIYENMGTTAVAAVIQDDNLFIANAGDSRAYLISEGYARQITRDHTEAAEMLEDGLISEEEALTSRLNNKLTRCVGAGPDIRVDVFGPIKIKVGDRIFLCSDGYTKYDRKGEMILELTSRFEPQEAARNLVNFALQEGGADNVTAMMVEVSQKVTPAEYKILGFQNSNRGPVDLQDPPTIIPKAKTQKKSNRSIRKLGLPITASIVGAILILFSGVYFYNHFPTPDTTQTASAGPDSFGSSPSSIPIITEGAFITTEATIEVPTVEITPTLPLIEPIITTTMQFSPTITVPNLPTQVPTPVTPSAPTAPFQMIVACGKRVVGGDNLTAILLAFNQSVTNEQYYYYLHCDENDGQLICEDKKPLPNPNSIQGGWWIEIANIANELCLQGGGLPIRQ